HLGEPDRGRLKELVASSTHIFFAYRSDQKEPIYNGNKGKKNFSLTIFFSGTKAPRRTRLVALESARRALYAHIFVIFLSETIAPRRTGPGSFENLTGVIGKGSSSPLRTYFFRPDRNNRSRVITHLGEPDWCHWKVLVAPSTPIFLCTDRTNRSRVITHLGEPDRGRLKELVAPSTPIFSSTRSHLREPDSGKKHCSLRIFLSETIAPRRTERGSLERARRALYAYIFFVQIGPIGAEWNKGKKNFSFAIFFSETVAPRRTGPGSFERARRALYAHIFFVQIGPIGAELLQFKDNKGKKHFYLRIFLSETIAPRRTGPRSIFLSETIGPRRTLRGSLERARQALYAHIFFVQIATIGAEGSKGKKNFSFTIFFSETIAPRRTGPGSFERARRVLYAHIFFVQIGPIGAELLQFKDNKGKKHFYLRIFLSETIAPRRTGPRSFESARRALYAYIFLENLTGVIGKGSSSPLRTYFFRPDRNNRSRVITVFREQRKKNFSLTIFFFGTIAPRRTRLGSSERARRALYAHIFFDQIGPIHLGEPDRGRLKELVASSTHIFFAYRSDQKEPIYNGNKGKKNFSLTIFFSGTKAPRRTGPGSFERARRVLYAHIFCVQIGPIGAEIFLSETIAPRRTERGSLERARRALYPYIFFVQIGPIGAEWNKGKKNFSFAIFFSETVAPRRTGPGSFERARRALYAHIFFVQIGPIGAELLQFKDNKGKKHFYLRIFLSETIAPRRTGPRSTIRPRRTSLGSLERARRALYAHIFLDQIGPIGAEL
ncbi:LOW QUALITY PROTEIN: hypothetical protein V1477_006727, partial [Vespula maculifrons]